MTEAEKLSLCKKLINDVNVTDEQILSYLLIASQRILVRLYPFGVKNEATVPAEYETTQCELAVRMIARRGGEGEITHNENGINRSYGTVNDEDILNRITPFVKVGANV